MTDEEQITALGLARGEPVSLQIALLGLVVV